MRVLLPDQFVETTSYGLEPAPLPGAPLHGSDSLGGRQWQSPRELCGSTGRVRASSSIRPRPERPVQVTAVSQYDYLPTGELTSIVDAEGNVTTLAYDLRGLRTRFSNPDTGLIEERFDAMGNRVALIEPNHRALGTEVHFVFERDRLTSIDYPSTHDVVMAYGASLVCPRVGVVLVDDKSGSRVRIRLVRWVKSPGPFAPYCPRPRAVSHWSLTRGWSLTLLNAFWSATPMVRPSRNLRRGRQPRARRRCGNGLDAELRH